MSLIEEIEAAPLGCASPHEWVGLVLDHFGRAEQALGELSLALGLPINNGSLGSLNHLRAKLASCGDRRSKALNQRIERWQTNRPYRHLLAHGRITIFYDVKGKPVVVTRHLPRDPDDVTRDKVWSGKEQDELLRQASGDGRSICDLVKNHIADKALLAILRQA